MVPRQTLSLTLLLPLTFLPLNLSQELGKEDVAYIDTTLKDAMMGLMNEEVRLYEELGRVISVLDKSSATETKVEAPKLKTLIPQLEKKLGVCTAPALTAGAKCVHIILTCTVHSV